MAQAASSRVKSIWANSLEQVVRLWLERTHDGSGFRVRDAATEDKNLMPPIIEASRAYVTMGEMCDALRAVWGVWRETPVF